MPDLCFPDTARGFRRNEQKLPFSDEELKTMHVGFAKTSTPIVYSFKLSASLPSDLAARYWRRLR